MDPAAPIPELAAYLAAHPGTRFVDAVLYDLCGTAIGKRVPVRDAAKLWSSGVAFCAGITTLDALGACWDVNGIGFSDGDPDATSYPLPGTLVPVPWAEVPTAQVQIAPAPPEGEAAWWFDPRAILQSVVARFAELGLRPVVANELEFYFVDPTRDAKGMVSPATPARSGRAPQAPRVLAFDKLDDGLDLLAELLVGHAEHRRVGHLGVGDQQVLGLLRIDVHAAGDDHVGLAVGQVQVALGVDIAHVAQRRPALGVGAAGGLGGVVVVRERTAVGEVDGAALAGRQLGAGLLDQAPQFGHVPTQVAELSHQIFFYLTLLVFDLFSHKNG